MPDERDFDLNSPIGFLQQESIHSICRQIPKILIPSYSRAMSGYPLIAICSSVRRFGLLAVVELLAAFVVPEVHIGRT
jgi:hypothetical protein